MKRNAYSSNVEVRWNGLGLRILDDEFTERKKLWNGDGK